MPDTPTHAGSEPVVLRFDATATLEDSVALQLRCLASPAMRRGRVRRIALSLLIAAALGPVSLAVGLLIGWMIDSGKPPPLGSLLHYVLVEELWTVPASALVLVGFALLGLVLQRLLLRPRLRRFLRRALRGRPGVDGADKQLRYRAHVTVDDEGIASSTAAGDTRLRWAALTRWEEAAGRLFVLGDGMVGFCFGTAGAPPEALDRLRVVLTTRLGPAAGRAA